MKRYTLTILTLLLLLSFSSYAQTGKKKKRLDIEQLTYFEPVFFHINQNEQKSIYLKFEKDSKVSLDSLFDKRSKKYRIKEKYNTADLNSAIENEIKYLFEEGANNFKNIKIPDSIKALNKNTNTQYGIFLLINTTSTGYPEINDIIKIQVEAIILDLFKNNIVFYQRSKDLSPIYNQGNKATLLKDLNYIYRRIKKL